jgi:hypothetical protein
MRSRAAGPRSTPRACDRPTDRRFPGHAPHTRRARAVVHAVLAESTVLSQRLTKGAHRIEHLDALVEHAREALKDMRRIGPDVEPDATVALRQPSSQTG